MSHDFILSEISGIKKCIGRIEKWQWLLLGGMAGLGVKEVILLAMGLGT